MAKKSNRRKVESINGIALCYIRLSFSRKEYEEMDSEYTVDSQSPDRQRANIEAVCNKYGWKPRFFEDVGGHKSARDISKRPQWQLLEAELTKPNVVAVVANDLSRIHRNSWRIKEFAERLQKLGIRLVLADSIVGEVDLSTMQGEIIVDAVARGDQLYADMLSQKAKDSVEYRKRRGITIGMPPFGTIRDKYGLLQPSQEGAWLLDDGTYQSGYVDDIPPSENAVWRGYYDCAKRILELYSSDPKIGYARVAYRLHEEGYVFRNRRNQPRNVEAHDVRRVVSNVFEYGGKVADIKAKDRPGITQDEPSYEMFNRERSVFPIQLLFDVATARKQKSFRPINRSSAGTRDYRFSQLIYCSECEKDAIASGSKIPTLASKKDNSNRTRYFHRQGRKCNCKRKSVTNDVFEPDFIKLLDLLTIAPHHLENMKTAALKLLPDDGAEAKELEETKRIKITKLQRGLKTIEQMAKHGDISYEQFKADKQDLMNQLAYWQAFTTDIQQIEIGLSACVVALNSLRESWGKSSFTDKQRNKLVHEIFSHITYDLDRQMIVGFGLQAWASYYLVLRGELYENTTFVERDPIQFQEDITVVPHRRLELLFLP